MKTRIIYISAILILLFIIDNDRLKAQDIHFSSWRYSPQRFNPAFTGQVPGKFLNRFNGIYRNQWAIGLQEENFDTYTLNYDRKLLFKNGDHFYGLGLNLAQDHSGSYFDENALLYDEFELGASGAVHIVLKGKGYQKNYAYLSLGTTFGMYHYRFDEDRLTFDSQFVDGAESEDDLGANTGEPYLSNGIFNQSRLDLKVGTNVTNLWTKGGNDQHIQLGFALHHVLPNRISLTDNANSETPHQLLSLLNFEYGVDYQRIGVDARLLYMRHGAGDYKGKQRQIFLGGTFWFYKNTQSIDSYSKVGLTVDVRLVNSTNVAMSTDAFSFGFLWESMGDKHITLGINADINISKWSRTSAGLGALELTAVYSFKKSPSLGVECP